MEIDRWGRMYREAQEAIAAGTVANTSSQATAKAMLAVAAAVHRLTDEYQRSRTVLDADSMGEGL
jgi:hypothetical protein